MSILLARSLSIMSGSIIAPALPRISQVFAHVPHAVFLSKMMLAVPAVVIALTAPIQGWLTDRYGRKRLLAACMLIYTFAGTSGLYLQDMYSLLIGRAFFGLAVAGITTLTTTLVADYFTGRERSHFMGIQATIMSTGGLTFISLGGILADGHWRAPFALYLAGFLILPIVMRFLYEPENHSTTPDTPGGKFESYPKHLIALIYCMTFFGSVFFFFIPVQIPFILQELTGASGTDIGIRMAGGIFSGAVIAFFYSRIKDHFSYSAIYSFIFGGMTIGFIGIGFAETDLHVTLSMIFSIMWSGLLMPNSNTWIVETAPPAYRGRIVGWMTTAIFVGHFSAPFIIQPIENATSLQGPFLAAALVMFLITTGFAVHFILNRQQPTVD